MYDTVYCVYYSILRCAVCTRTTCFPRLRLQHFLENLVGTSSAQFGNDRFHIVVCDLAAKDANVLQQLLDAFDGLVLGRGGNRGGRCQERGVAMALKDEFLLETGRNFLLVTERVETKWNE